MLLLDHIDCRRDGRDGGVAYDLGRSTRWTRREWWRTGAGQRARDRFPWNDVCLQALIVHRELSGSL